MEYPTTELTGPKTDRTINVVGAEALVYSVLHTTERMVKLVPTGFSFAVLHLPL